MRRSQSGDGPPRCAQADPCPETAVTPAQNNLDASIARYRAGEAQIIEVTDAQANLAAQRLAYYQALFDYRVGLARLKQAAGQ